MDWQAELCTSWSGSGELQKKFEQDHLFEADSQIKGGTCFDMENQVTVKWFAELEGMG